MGDQSEAPSRAPLTCREVESRTLWPCPFKLTRSQTCIYKCDEMLTFDDGLPSYWATYNW